MFPCREGTGWMEKVLHRIENGHGREEDIDLLLSIQSKIEGNTICPLGDGSHQWQQQFILEKNLNTISFRKNKNRDHLLRNLEKVKHLVSKVTV
jgi:NADH-quinone oxidoreductase subunit F